MIRVNVPGTRLTLLIMRKLYKLIKNISNGLCNVFNVGPDLANKIANLNEETSKIDYVRKMNVSKWG